MNTELYTVQNSCWPQSGRHILAQYDTETVIVYQAFSPQIAQFACEHGFFGGPFSLGRMSWIKPNFLWMMFRCGWATKENQERVLAVSLRRAAFDSLLAQAVPSAFDPALFAGEAKWRHALAQSDVRLQWDPDHDPAGGKVERRALQLGLRGETLARYAREWIAGIEDVTAFVAAQSGHALGGQWERLRLPCEQVYPVASLLAAQLGMESPRIAPPAPNSGGAR